MEAVELRAAEKRMVIFSKSSCCMCHAIKTLLWELGSDPKVFELDNGDPQGSDIEATLLTLGLKPAVPAVFFDGKLVGGAKDVISLHLKGSLISLILRERCCLWSG